MKISYSMLVHNETKSLETLIDFLVANKDEEDEIVILDDYSDDKETRRILDSAVSVYDIKYEQRELLGDFASQKNHLKNMCTGEYIFNLDADELPHKFLMKNIKAILEANPTIDLFWVPRVNTVDGITQDHIQKWGWNVNENGWVNFPDYQGRIWKNRPNILWKNKVHEVLNGYRDHSYLPADEQFSFYHPKDIDRQEKQNALYDTIIIPPTPLRAKGYKTIKLFTTFNKFDYETNIIQRNAIDSWKRISRNVDIYVFADDKEVEEICKKENLNYVSEFKNENGLPYINSMMKYMQSIANENDILCYINSDIILFNDFIDSLDCVSNNTEKQFLMIGQRTDWNHNSVKRLNVNNVDREEVLSNSNLHGPGGIDVFAYTKYFYNPDNIPSYLIARGRFDHWLVGYALDSNLPVFDSTDTNFIIHQDLPNPNSGDPFDEVNQGTLLGQQILDNNMLFSKHRKHGQTDMTRYKLYNDNSEIKIIERNFDTDIPVNEFGEKAQGGSL